MLRKTLCHAFHISYKSTRIHDLLIKVGPRGKSVSDFVFFFLTLPRNRWISSEIRKSGGHLPLPGSSTLLPPSFPFLFFFPLSSTFPCIKKKKHAASFHAPHGTLSYFFISFFLKVGREGVNLPASPYFPPLDSDPFVQNVGPCPASSDVRIFFSPFFSTSFFSLVESHPKRGVVDGEKKVH